MMKSEFYERTKKTVSDEEYHFIEESYYEFDGDKDAFCKSWLKDQKNGTWAKEYRLRQKIEYQEKEYKEKEKKYKEYLDFYSAYYDKAIQAKRDLNSLMHHLSGLVEDVNAYKEKLEY